jgi:hypothetical protein
MLEAPAPDFTEMLAGTITLHFLTGSFIKGDTAASAPK